MKVTSKILQIDVAMSDTSTKEKMSIELLLVIDDISFLFLFF